MTPDTILKWIHSGRLPARRTAGGHHRIDGRDLERALGPAQTTPSGSELRPITSPPEASPAFRTSRFRYCWEYNSRGGLPAGCRECIVYQLRAQRCYEVARIQSAIGHTKLYCKGSCTDCDYYRRVHMQVHNVMVVTDDPVLTATLRRERSSVHFNMEFSDCEYTCSAVVDRFRPDYVVVDCSLGPERAGDICNHLLVDPRLPYVRVIMAVDQGQFPRGCDKKVFAQIEKPFQIEDITRCLEGAQHEGAQHEKTVNGSPA